jgi:hypothetical protein
VRFLRVSVFCGVFVVALVASATSAVADTIWPPGGQDTDEFYWCHASIYDSDNTTFAGEVWSDIECEQLTWQSDGQGGYVSVSMDYWVDVSGTPTTGEAAIVWAVVVPATGIESYTFACEGVASVCHLGGSAGFVASMEVDDGGVYFGGADYIAGAPAPPADACASVAVDWVGEEHEQLAGAWQSRPWPVGQGDYPFFRVDGRTGDSDRAVDIFFQCQITGWEDEIGWFPVIPTPVPTPGFAILPFPIGTVPIGRPPTTISFGISDPVTGTCYTLVPSTEQEVVYWGGVYTVGFEAVEICAAERSFDLVVDEFDFGAFLLVLIGLSGVGGVWAMLRGR